MKHEGMLAGCEWSPRGARIDVGWVVLIECPAGKVGAEVLNVSAAGFRVRTARALEEFQPTEIEGNGSVTFTIDSLDLVEGTYRLDLAAHKADGYPYDYHRLLYTFRVKSRIRDVGIYRPDHSWSFEGGIKIKS